MHIFLPKLTLIRLLPHRPTLATDNPWGSLGDPGPLRVHTPCLLQLTLKAVPHWLNSIIPCSCLATITHWFHNCVIFQLFLPITSNYLAFVMGQVQCELLLGIAPKKIVQGCTHAIGGPVRLFEACLAF
jgi:hypothetical protein